jgi:long-chain acyl-CoA synthetase
MEKTGYPSVDKPWNKYYSNSTITKEEVEKRISKSMYQMYDESTKNIEDNITVEYYGSLITNRELKKRILMCAKSLTLLGVKPGDIVPLVLPNQPESRIMIYAVNVIGAIAYPIQPNISPKQLEQIIYENNVKNLAVFRGFYRQYKTPLKNVENIIYTTAKESLPNVIKHVDKLSHLDPLNVIPYDEFILESKTFKGTITPVYKKNQTAAIIGTSGTTGIPKGVCLTNENLNAMALQHQLGEMGIEVGDKLLNILIDSIGYGLGTMHYSCCCGVHSILIPELVTNVAPLFLKYHPQHFTGGPIHSEELEKYIKNPKNEKNLEELNHILYEEVKNWVSGGAPLKKTTEDFLNKEKILVRQGLGCTENGGAATFSKKGTYKEKSVGIPLMLETISIFEKGTDNELKYYEEGEICIKGPTVMKGYHNNPDETDKVLIKHDDGNIWIHTGDKGYMDEDGNVYITGRYKQMTHRFGFNIHPQKITDSLNSTEIKGIVKCYVTTLPHPKQQNVPVAFVSIEPNTNINKIKKALIEYSTKKLDKYSAPYDYIFVMGDLPNNLGGKVDEKKLLEQAKLNYSENQKPRYEVITSNQKVKKK